MNKTFILAIISISLTIFIEYANLALQIRDRKLTKWFGKKAFYLHMSLIGILWMVTFLFVVVLQFAEHPLFHQNIILKFAGMILFICGIILATWAFKLLGVKRSSHLNIFEDNVPIVRKSLYKYIKNPEYCGFWTALIGFTIFTGSIYNLIITVEFIILMIPLMTLENSVRLN